jgi:hypothetical protein
VVGVVVGASVLVALVAVAVASRRERKAMGNSDLGESLLGSSVAAEI